MNGSKYKHKRHNEYICIVNLKVYEWLYFYASLKIAATTLLRLL